MRIRKQRQWLLYLLLALVSLLTRFYDLGRNPLWYDELYSYQVSSQDLPAIIRNSFCDTSPPLHFLLLKVTSGFGLWRTEWGLRWFSAVCGALILVVFFHLAARVTNRWSAGLAWLMLLASPTLMYYSQEARAYIVAALVALLTTAIVFNLSNSRGPSHSLWGAWGLLSLVGVYTSYSYLIVLPIQALYLAALFRWRREMVITTVVVFVGILFLTPLLRYNLGNSLQRTAGLPPLTFLSTIQTLLAGELPRYGFYAGAIWLSLLLGALACMGIWSAVTRVVDKFGMYLAAQVVVPLAGYFGIGVWLFGWHMPTYQSRQFLVLVPAFYLLVALGILWCVDRFPAGTGYLAVSALCVAVLVASAAGLQRYWTGTKSPEGAALQMVSSQLKPEDGVVGLGDSIVSAASFYLPQGYRVYTTPQATDAGYFFEDDTSVLCSQAKPSSRFPVAAIHAHARTWIVSDTRRDPAVRNTLVQRCQIGLQQMFGPFEVLQVQQCAG